MGEAAFSTVRDVLHADPSVAAAIVYGSAARGQLRPDSDLDVAVLRASDPATAEPPLLEQLGALGEAAGRDVHLTDLEAVDCGLRRSIFAEGIRLFDRSEGALRRLEHATAIEYVDWEHARRIIDAGLKRHLESAGG